MRWFIHHLFKLFLGSAAIMAMSIKWMEQKMNALIKTVLVTTLGFGAAFTAFANTPTDAKAAQRTDMMAKMQAHQAELFQQADANKDGKLSSVEFDKFNQLKKEMHKAHQEAREKQRFARLDSNKDGMLSLDELKASYGKKGMYKHHDGASSHAKPAM